jgi:hypothetical protein
MDRRGERDACQQSARLVDERSKRTERYYESQLQRPRWLREKHLAVFIALRRVFSDSDALFANFGAAQVDKTAPRRDIIHPG